MVRMKEGLLPTSLEDFLSRDWVVKLDNHVFTNQSMQTAVDDFNKLNITLPKVNDLERRGSVHLQFSNILCHAFGLLNETIDGLFSETDIRSLQYDIMYSDMVIVDYTLKWSLLSCPIHNSIYMKFQALLYLLLKRFMSDVLTEEIIIRIIVNMRERCYVIVLGGVVMRGLCKLVYPLNCNLVHDLQDQNKKVNINFVQSPFVEATGIEFEESLERRRTEGLAIRNTRKERNLRLPNDTYNLTYFVRCLGLAVICAVYNFLNFGCDRSKTEMFESLWNSCSHLEGFDKHICAHGWWAKQVKQHADIIIELLTVLYWEFFKHTMKDVMSSEECASFALSLKPVISCFVIVYLKTLMDYEFHQFKNLDREDQLKKEEKQAYSFATFRKKLYDQSKTGDLIFMITENL
jgi:hypothetical protein